MNWQLTNRMASAESGSFRMIWFYDVRPKGKSTNLNQEHSMKWDNKFEIFCRSSCWLLKQKRVAFRLQKCVQNAGADVGIWYCMVRYGFSNGSRMVAIQLSIRKHSHQTLCIYFIFTLFLSKRSFSLIIIIFYMVQFNSFIIIWYFQFF